MVATKIVALDWTSTQSADAALNDSDKTFTVTFGKQWHIFSVYVSLVSSATVGNRQMTVVVTDASDNFIGEVRAGAVQAAGATRKYMFAPGLADLTSFRDTNYLMTPIPPTWILPGGYKIRIYDSAAVDAAADDMTVRVLYGVGTGD